MSNTLNGKCQTFTHSTFMKKEKSEGTSGAACQVCGRKPLTLILALGHQPVTQRYLSEQTLREPETTYPLHLCRCARCGLIQLDYIVAPEIVFPKEYPYRTGLTNMLVRNFHSLAEALETHGYFKPNDLIVDIGSNDGTLLKPFRARGGRVIGVEPTDAAKAANRSGIPTIQEFFDKAAAEKIRRKYGAAKLVTATNVFAHIQYVPELMQNIKTLMPRDSIFVSESQYLMDIVEKREFDTIYHEHLRFYSAHSLKELFKRFSMTLYDAERIEAAGGSIRAYAARGKRAESARVRSLLAAEEKAGLNTMACYRKFAADAIAAKQRLLTLLLEIKRKGKRIAALTSPARSNTLLNFARIGADLIDYAGEKEGSPKMGLFTPGMHIPVVNEARIFRGQPDYLLILSWHIGEELMKIMRKKGYRGTFIMPLPKPRIITNL